MAKQWREQTLCAWTKTSWKRWCFQNFISRWKTEGQSIHLTLIHEWTNGQWIRLFREQLSGNERRGKGRKEMSVSDWNTLARGVGRFFNRNLVTTPRVRRREGVAGEFKFESFELRLIRACTSARDVCTYLTEARTYLPEARAPVSDSLT